MKMIKHGSRHVMINSERFSSV